MNGRFLVQICVEEAISDVQSHDPEVDTDTKCEETAESDHVATGLQPPTHRHEKSRQRSDEGDDDEGTIRNSCRERELFVQQIACRFLAIVRVHVHEVPDDEAER